MNKKFFPWLVFMALTLAVNACGGAGASQVPAATSATTASAELAQAQPLAQDTPLPQPTATPEPSTTPLPPATSTPEPTSTPSLPAVPGRAWNTLDRYDPSLPELIVAGEKGLGLDPGWQVAAIDYVYEWWGWGVTPVLDYQQIVAEKGKYTRGEEKVNPKQVQKFLDSIVHLRPTQMLLGGYYGTDNYPTWKVELTGQDGQHILIESLSTGNPNNGPWNVIYNGRLYAQYDGTLGEQIANLFPGEQGQPIASYSAGDRDPGAIVYQTSGLPGELLFGFNGLLPLASTLEYHVDVENNEIRGRYEGSSTIGWSGDLILGGITGLQSILMLREDGAKIPCEVQKVEAGSAHIKKWDFTCPVENVEPGGAYRLPVEFTVTSRQGETIVSEGEFYGTWESTPDIISVPMPEEVALALRQSPEALVLLETHPVSWASYQADTTSDSPKMGTFAGEVTFLGDTQLDGQPLRYSVSTPLAIQNGKLTRFGLSQSALDELLAQVLASPITQRVLSTRGDVVLNLWYSEPGPWPELPYLTDQTSTDYVYHLEACGSIPAADLPSAEQPLKAFGFNQYSLQYRVPQFLLVGEDTVVGYLNLDAETALSEGGVEAMLIPPQLVTQGRQFTGIELDNATPWRGWQNRLTLQLPEDASAEDLVVYDGIVDQLPGYVDRFYPDYWSVEGIGFVASEDGKIDLVNCAAPGEENVVMAGSQQKLTITTYPEISPALDVSSSPMYPNEHIWAVMKDKIGRWVLSTGSFVDYATSKWMGNAELTQVAINDYNLVWVGTADQGVYSFDGDEWVQYTGKDGPPGNRIHSLFLDDNSYLWAATDNGVAQYDGIKWIVYAPEEGWPNPEILAIAEKYAYPKKTFWFAMNGDGIASKTVNDWQFYTRESTQGGLASDQVISLKVMQGVLWAGTQDAGISSFDEETWKTYTIEDGLPSNTILCITWTNDPYRALWVGTDRGLARFDGRHWKAYTTQDGLPDDRILAITAVNGILWLATEAGVVSIDLYK